MKTLYSIILLFAMIICGCVSTLKFSIEDQLTPIASDAYPQIRLFENRDSSYQMPIVHILDLNCDTEFKTSGNLDATYVISIDSQPDAPPMWHANCISYVRKIVLKNITIDEADISQFDMNADKLISMKDVHILAEMLTGKRQKRKWNMASDTPMKRDTLNHTFLWNPAKERHVRIKLVKVCGDLIEPLN